MKIILGITGASGVQYGFRVLESLIALNHEVHLIISDGAKKVFEVELKDGYEDIIDKATVIYDIKDIGASIASGTNQNDGMIIVPCSMKTLAAIASGISNNLIQRAADCMLKEGRKLVLVPRETPLSLIHLNNMVICKQAGATILPASPGFYYKPKSIDDLINFIVGRILNIFRIDHQLFKPWNP